MIQLKLSNGQVVNLNGENVETIFAGKDGSGFCTIMVACLSVDESAKDLAERIFKDSGRKPKILGGFENGFDAPPVMVEPEERETFSQVDPRPEMNNEENFSLTPGASFEPSPEDVEEVSHGKKGKGKK